MSRFEFGIDEYTDETSYTPAELRLLADSDYNWYLVQYTDGRDSDVQHATSLSCILQCGHDPADYDIARITRCDHDVWASYAPLLEYEARFANKFFWCTYKIICESEIKADAICETIIEELEDQSQEEFEMAGEGAEEDDYEYKLIEIDLVDDMLDVDIYSEEYTMTASGGNG